MTGTVDMAARLRAIAAILEAHPDLPTPDVEGYGAETGLKWGMFGSVDTASRIAQIMKALGGKWDKNEPTNDYDVRYYELTREYDGIPLAIVTYRDRVCERVVTGTREVTREVPTATETVTVTEDVVVWRCKPILAGVQS